MFLLPIKYILKCVSRTDGCLGDCLALTLFPALIGVVIFLIIMGVLLYYQLSVLLFHPVMTSWLYGITTSYLQSFATCVFMYKFLRLDLDPTDWNKEYRKYSISVERKIPCPELDEEDFISRHYNEITKKVNTTVAKTIEPFVTKSSPTSANVNNNANYNPLPQQINDQNYYNNQQQPYNNQVYQPPTNQIPYYQSVPYQSVPYQSAPHQSAPHQSAPHQSAAYQFAPYQSAPYQSAPYNNAQFNPYQPVSYQPVHYQPPSVPTQPESVVEPTHTQLNSTLLNSTLISNSTDVLSDHLTSNPIETPLLNDTDKSND